MPWWDWPQWAMAIAILLTLCGKVAQHGKTHEYNAGYAILDAVIASWLLWKGDFWS